MGGRHAILGLRHVCHCWFGWPSPGKWAHDGQSWDPGQLLEAFSFSRLKTHARLYIYIGVPQRARLLRVARCVSDLWFSACCALRVALWSVVVLCVASRSVVKLCVVRWLVVYLFCPLARRAWWRDMFDCKPITAFRGQPTDVHLRKHSPLAHYGPDARCFSSQSMARLMLPANLSTLAP